MWDMALRDPRPGITHRNFQIRSTRLALKLYTSSRPVVLHGIPQKIHHDSPEAIWVTLDFQAGGQCPEELNALVRSPSLSHIAALGKNRDGIESLRRLRGGLGPCMLEQRLNQGLQ